jgi:hypothetical protein
MNRGSGKEFQAISKLLSGFLATKIVSSLGGGLKACNSPILDQTTNR